MQEWTDTAEYIRDMDDAEEEIIERVGLPTCVRCGKALSPDSLGLKDDDGDWLCETCVDEMLQTVDVDWDAVAEERRRMRKC